MFKQLFGSKMTTIRPIPEAVMDSSDSSDSCGTVGNNNETSLSLYKPALKYNEIMNKLDSYNNNQLLLPTQFYKTLLAKAVMATSNGDDKNNVYKNMFFGKDRDFDQKAFGWDTSQTGGSPAGPQSGGMGGQGAQGLVHWMSVMAEHMDPAMSHYMGWNQECGQHGKDDYPNWTRNTMGMGKQGYESKMNEHNQMQKVYAGMEDHHMANTPGLYTSGRSTSSSSSPGVPGSSPALLVVPQPINATKMGGMQNGGVQPRKYQCKMCPQFRKPTNRLVSKIHVTSSLRKLLSSVSNCTNLESRLDYRGLDFHQPPPGMLPENNPEYMYRAIDSLRSLGGRLGDRDIDLRMNLHHQDYHRAGDRLDRNYNHQHQGLNDGLELNLSLNSSDRLLQGRTLQQDLMQQQRNSLDRMINERVMHHEQRINLNHSLSLDRLNLERSLSQSLDRNLNLTHLQNNNNERTLCDRGNLNGDPRLLDRNNTLGYGPDRDGHRNPDLSDLKYREYKAHLENMRESSRSSEGGGGGGIRGDEVGDRGATPSTPPTPLSVGENFHEEKVFSSKAELQMHTQAHMREAKPYKCSQCCKAFANSSYLSQHTRIHLGIKPYRCEICQRKFTQLSHLQQHIRTHTGDKPYKCRHPGCQKAFSQLSNLQSHSRCHQTDKPYKCNSCYKCFSDEPSLLEHIPKHKESKHLKTHICQYCGKSYTQETYLQKHMQKHAERTDKRPPIGPGIGLNHRGLDHPYWPKVSPDSAENMHDYPTDIPRGLLEQNEDLVIIRQQLSGQNASAPPGAGANLGNSYDTSISKSNTNSAFTPINSMSGHLNHLNHQLAPNRPYLYDPLPFGKQNSLDIPKSQPSNGFPNQLISLHQIRNYQPNSSLMEHSILGGLKDK